MQERKRLRSFDLTGARAAIRRLLFGALPALAMVGALGYLLPAHRVAGDTHFHSNFDDGGITSLLAFGAAAAIAFALRRFRFGAGILAGALSMGGAVVAIMPVILVHLFSRVEYGIGEPVFAVGVLGMFFVGGATILAEPVLYLLERRSLERASKPAQLPVARVYG